MTTRQRREPVHNDVTRLSHLYISVRLGPPGFGCRARVTRAETLARWRQEHESLCVVLEARHSYSDGRLTGRYDINV